MSIKQNFPAIRPSLLLDFANTRTLDPRITFTRASTATFYDGKTTAMAEQNLFTYSQEFDNAAWSKSNVTVTANASIAPDGATTAELIVPTTANITHSVFRGFTSGVQTLSVFAKAAGYNYVSVSDAANGFIGQFTVDLTTGTITQNTASAFITATVTNAGNGWYRISISRNFTAGVQLHFAPTNTETGGGLYTPTPFAGDGTSGIYLWGAQLEQRSTVTAYTPTTTQAITNYIPALQTAASGVARFDCNPTTNESLGLLIEESRTNLVTYSDDFSNAAWVKSNSTVTANTIVAPDGTLTADKLFESTSAGGHDVRQAGTLASGTNTFSVYLKAAERTWALIQVGGAVVGLAYVNLATGAIGTVTGGFTATAVSVGNGWWRCSITGISQSTAATVAGVYLALNNNSFSYTGDGYGGIYIWGAQLEAGAFATSYIPTVASQVTRAADAASMTDTNFSSWYNQAAGTIYTESSSFSPAATRQSYGISDNTISNRIVGASSLDSSLFVATSGVQQANINTNTVAANVATKLAAAVTLDNFAVCRDNGTVFTDSSGLMPLVNRMFIGNGATGSGAALNGTIKKIAYYPLRVTNAQLQGLTS